MLQHFDYPEVLSYEGNSTLSDASKFGKSCAYFSDSVSSIKLTNKTGGFNLSASGSAEVECFVKTVEASSVLLRNEMIDYLVNNDCNMYNGHVYKVYTNTAKWADAKTACENLGGYLATITSIEEQGFISSFLTTPNLHLLGGQKVNDVWQWVTGEEWNYTNWETTYPSSTSSYISLAINNNNYNNNPKWRNVSSTTSYPYICEWNSPEAAYWGLNGYKVYNGHTFKIFDTYNTWEEAKAHCEFLGGHLATSTSAEKNSWIAAFANRAVWLGATEVEEGVWQWITGEEWNYTNWVSGQPDDNENLDGLLLNYYAIETWSDNAINKNNYQYYNFLCEWDFDILSATTPKRNLEKLVFYNNYNCVEWEGRMLKILYANNGYSSIPSMWQSVKAFCELLGGCLASVTSAEKQTLVQLLSNSYNAWLGGQEVNGQWQWLNGDEWSYTNWSSNNPSESIEDGRLLKIGDGTWTENASDAAYPGYICEWGSVETAYWSLNDYFFYNGHTFKCYTQYLTWHDAKVACEAVCGHLATNTSAEKNAFLASLITYKLSTMQTSAITMWLGGTDEVEEGVWRWITGEEWDYSDESFYNYENDDYLAFTSIGGISTVTWESHSNTATYFYICEWDFDMRCGTSSTGDIMNFSDALKLSIAQGNKLSLTSPIWKLYKYSTVEFTPSTWHHILLRLLENTAKVFLDGTEAISTSIASNIDITPTALTLGGYVGYMYEFVFRDEAGTGAPTVPTSPYEIGTGSATTTTSNAPVTRAVWSCSNLPEGLTLSSSGVLSGHPTTAGTYNCNVQVATNWGTASKTIKITVSE